MAYVKLECAVISLPRFRSVYDLTPDNICGHKAKLNVNVLFLIIRGGTLFLF